MQTMSENPLEKFIKEKLFYQNKIIKESLDKETIFLSTVNFRLLQSLFDPQERRRWFPSVDRGLLVAGDTGVIFDLNQDIFSDNILNICVRDSVGNVSIYRMHPAFANTRYPILRTYALNNSRFSYAVPDDMMAAEAIAPSLGIDINKPFACIDVEKYGFFHSWMVHNPQNEQILFENINGIQSWGVILRHDSEGKVLLSPSIPIGRHPALWPAGIELMPSPPLPLFQLGEIYHFPKRKIILTESLLLADHMKKMRFSPDDPIVTTWFHGKDGIEYTDWGPLRDREVFYCLAITGILDDDRNAALTALSLYHHLYQTIGRSQLKFRIITIDKWQETRIYKSDDFCKLCSDLNIRRPVYIRDFSAELENASLITFKEKINYLISPIITNNTLAILFAPSGVGKSWLSMSIGVALASGKSVCSKWQVSQACNVLYVAGEMDKCEINNRLLILKKHYGLNSNSCGTLRYKLCDKDLGAEEGQEELESSLDYLDSHNEHTALLILDNLNCLVANAEHKSAWDKFFTWISRLKKKFAPLAILIIHHTNKEGEVAGTAAIKNRLDLMIKAQSNDPIQEKIDKLASREEQSPLDTLVEQLQKRYQTEIPMHISFEKVRSLSKKQATPFTMTFNPEKPELGWIVTEPEYLQKLYVESTASSVDDGSIYLKIEGEESDHEEVESLSPDAEQKDANVLSGSKNDFVKRLTEEISQIDLSKTWRGFSGNEKFIVSNYLREAQGLSAKKISDRYNVSLRTIQNALNNKKFK